MLIFQQRYGRYGFSEKTLILVLIYIPTCIRITLKSIHIRII